MTTTQMEHIPNVADTTGPALSVVLPAHNEEGQISATVASCVNRLTAMSADYEVIVVDDGSTDQTGAIAEAMAEANRRIRVVHNVPQRGYGGALRAGFDAATKSNVFFMDSDGQFDFNDITSLLPYKEQGYRAVVGYRERRQDPLIRIINARAWGALVWLLFHIHVRDVDCAFKLFDRALLQGIDIQSEGAMINTEILVKLEALGINVVQVAVRHYPRQQGAASGADLKVIARAFRELYWMRKMVRTWDRGTALQPRPVPPAAPS
jgi:glycosyltransferase involved in cell wall biosynthesis